MAFIGFLLTKFKKMPLAPIITRIGFSSAFFGLFYGSIFGNEEILHNFYAKFGFTPLNIMDSSMTMTMLIGTVAIGAVLILTSIGINFITKLKHKHYGDAIFSSNGIMGFILYGFVLIGIALQMLKVASVFNLITIILFVVVPIISIFFKEPIEHLLEKQKPFPDGIGGFIVQGFFELFEVILSYVTNTVSFLRVGGFILSHAGMMMVVNTLMEMSGNGSVVVAIIGNLFVMGLEGLIVGIQVLRLEFYEMFSRYYEGDGVPFTPIKF